jgi:mono/diheme cytochrome c family protein
MRAPVQSKGTSRKAGLVALALAFNAIGPAACSRSDQDPARSTESSELATTPAAETGTHSLVFLSESQTVVSLTVEELTQRIRPRRVEVFEPYERARVAFTALPLERVFDEAYGPSWRTRDAILFSCRDGYEPTIPVRRVLDHRAYLAVDRSGAIGFTVLKDEEGTKKRIELGPFYVIWENLDNARIRTEGDYGWPYQVVRIDLVSFRSHFREMAPPQNASTDVLAGFDAFVAHCSKCHTINGRGGAIGPELNYPVNPTEYLKDEWLRKWIDDPKSMRLAPRMPPLSSELPERARIIDEIVAYLDAMASHKIDPEAP